MKIGRNEGDHDTLTGDHNLAVESSKVKRQKLVCFIRRVSDRNINFARSANTRYTLYWVPF